MEVGIDCIEIKRFDEILLSNKRFLSRVFTEDEIEYCLSKPRPPQHFAGCFTVKEAVIKAILADGGEKPAFSMIELVHDPGNRPEIRLRNYHHPCCIKVSVSHSDTIATAVALLSHGNDQDITLS